LSHNTLRFSVIQFSRCSLSRRAFCALRRAPRAERDAADRAAAEARPAAESDRPRQSRQLAAEAPSDRRLHFGILPRQVAELEIVRARHVVDALERVALDPFVARRGLQRVFEHLQPVVGRLVAAQRPIVAHFEDTAGG
jgi:hypothetical protein